MTAKDETSSSSSRKRKEEGSSFKRNGGDDTARNASKKRKPYQQQQQEDSELSTSAQKRKLKKERQSHRRHADAVTDAKDLWNSLRKKTNTTEQTKELMERVMDLIRGKVNEIALQHDASRIVQAAVQFGSPSQRKELLKEITESETGSLVELAKIQYAHFCCLKFIKYCVKDDESVAAITKAFVGHIPHLAVHSVGSRVLESLFLTFPTKQTNILKQELYGPHYSLFAASKDTVPTLSVCLEAAQNDTQKEHALKFVKGIVNKGIAKSFFALSYFQELLAEYVDVADPSDVREMAGSIVDQSIHMLSTRAGAKVVAACASYSTPKDRKRICKSLKGYTSSSLLHRDAYLAVLQLVQVMDDTVAVKKTILNELFNAPPPTSTADGTSDSASTPLLDIALSETGSKLFLLVLVEDDAARMKYFDPYEQEILQSNPCMLSDGKQVPTSKKDPAIRRKELLSSMETSLQELCVTHTEKLLRSVPGSRLLKEVYNSSHSSQVVDAILDVCSASAEATAAAGANEKKEDTGSPLSIFEDTIGHRALKNLILCDKQEGGAVDGEASSFASRFAKRMGGHFAVIMASNRGAFVMTALLQVLNQASFGKEGAGLKKTLKQVVKGLAPKQKSTAGFKALQKELGQ